MSDTPTAPEVHYDYLQFNRNIWSYLGTSEIWKAIPVQCDFRLMADRNELYLVKPSSPYPTVIPPGRWKRTSPMMVPGFEGENKKWSITLKDRTYLYAIHTTDLFMYDGEGEEAWVVIRPGFKLERYDTWRDIIREIGEERIMFVTPMKENEVYALSMKEEAADVKSA